MSQVKIRSSSTGRPYVRDAAVALLNQVAHHLVSTLVVVEHHGADLQAVQYPVEEHQRNAALVHLLEVPGIVRGARQRHQNAFDLSVDERVDVVPLTGHVLVRLAHHHVEARLTGHLFDAVQHRRKEVPIDVGHHHA